MEQHRARLSTDGLAVGGRTLGTRLAVSQTAASRANRGLGRPFTPVVLTFRRPRIAEETVRHLIASEGIPPEDIVLVINGEGGIVDGQLQSRLDVLRLDHNVGPALGFRTGLEYAVSTRSAPWVYVLEDDAGLLDLPVGRANRIVRDLASRPDHRSVGAVVAYGRTFAGDTGRTLPHVPGERTPDFARVDVAAWGATLIRREVLADFGCLPDPDLFFGYEDFDFFLRVRAAGWDVVVDTLSERLVGDQVTDRGRSRVFDGERPTDAREPWREYYRARNFLVIQRRWGNWRWGLDHLLRSARRLQLAGWDRVVAGAILRGLSDGLRGKLGPSPRYQREAGEYNQG